MREGWTYKKIGEIGTILRGKGIQKTDFIENGQPCIHYGQIHTAFGVSTEKHLSTISLNLYNKSIIASNGDVLLTLTSEDVEGSCKCTAWLGNYDIAVSSDAAVIKHSLNPKFFVYYTRSKSFSRGRVAIAVIWSFGHLSKSKTDCVKTATIINILFIYIVSNDHVSKIDFDQMTLTK